MELCICGISSLSILRSIRCARRALPATRCGLVAPDPGGKGRWSRKALARALDGIGPAAGFSAERPLHVMAPSAQSRLQPRWATSSVCSLDLPSDAFVRLDNGVRISSPELLFIEMGAVMSPAIHLLLGMELTGRFSRDAEKPREGNAFYDIEPVTSVAKLSAFIDACPNIKGVVQARKTVDLIVENAWSPMEAIIAALFSLPLSEMGYNLSPINLNERKVASEELAGALEKDSRVPDLLIRGTKIGLNYDGSDHFGLKHIADAARLCGARPGEKHLEDELAEAMAESRKRIIADKRRDRDLATMGYTVLPITLEDLAEQGALDRVVKQLCIALERAGRDMSLTLLLLDMKPLAKSRQEFIWSMMPGGSGNAVADSNPLRNVVLSQATVDLATGKITGKSTVDISHI